MLYGWFGNTPDLLHWASPPSSPLQSALFPYELVKKPKVTNCVDPISKWDRRLFPIRIGIRNYQLRVLDFLTDSMGDEPHYTESIISCQGDSAGETWNHECARIVRIMQ
jgi:hypothetical protein